MPFSSFSRDVGQRCSIGCRSPVAGSAPHVKLSPNARICFKTVASLLYLGQRIHKTICLTSMRAVPAACPSSCTDGISYLEIPDSFHLPSSELRHAEGKLIMVLAIDRSCSVRKRWPVAGSQRAMRRGIHMSRFGGGGMSQTMGMGFRSRLKRHATYAANRQTKVRLRMGPMADPARLWGSIARIAIARSTKRRACDTIRSVRARLPNCTTHPHIGND